MVMILHRGGPFKYPRRRSARSGNTLSLRGARASAAGCGISPPARRKSPC